MALIIGDLLSARFGNDVQSVPPPAFLAGSVSLAGQEYPSYRLAVIVAGLALAVLVWLLVERSRAGALVRATVADAPMVQAWGRHRTAGGGRVRLRGGAGLPGRCWGRRSSAPIPAWTSGC